MNIELRWLQKLDRDGELDGPPVLEYRVANEDESGYLQYGYWESADTIYRSFHGTESLWHK